MDLASEGKFDELLKALDPQSEDTDIDHQEIERRAEAEMSVGVTRAARTGEGTKEKPPAARSTTVESEVKRILQRIRESKPE
mmetsp:Transcript_26367/g.41240  ORF Transcript_26367/g.41240 Transcript_26367/m.41240 type:complete len:82 (+) Transcript_26367:562-807(+)|eukprot:CAMPEP_0184297840 /NCGR_PEP_ID=MMETSP1049-20130417/8717_1 /TAXON_ID=77928 /ORGANISM="Proteomonas sulcata, Strain CCMP704" /LENGTH=81 /DNA_ID=CAMNT_0026607753 /DNA_START=557 /DNA_END=802 /DNA_ORIENTATION=+